MKSIDQDKAQIIGQEVLKTVDEYLSDPRMDQDPSTGRYRGFGAKVTVRNAVEVVSIIDSEKALGLAEKIETGSSERAEAFLYIYESCIHHLFLMGVKVQ